MSSIVSSITGSVGGNGGGAGLNYNASNANLVLPTTQAQAEGQYSQAQSGITQQSNFLNALQAQNGIGNQSSVFNQLQGVANGTGPNPAQAQLAQATGANVANQASLMAGQRGASQNVGLIARQAAQQGAQTQQQSAGQAATLQAQQSLGALQNLGNLATTQVGQQQNQVNTLSGAEQAEQSNILNAISQQNNAQVGIQSNMNSSNALISAEAAKNQGQFLGNITGATGASGLLAEGGKVQRYAEGTPYIQAPQISSSSLTSGPSPAPSSSSNPNPPQSPGPKSGVGQFFQSFGNNSSSPGSDSSSGAGQAGANIGKMIGKGLQKLFNSSVQANVPNVSGSSGYLPGGSYGDISAMPNGAEMTDASLDSSDAGALGADAGEAADAAEGAGDIGDLAALAAARGGRVPAMVSPGEKYLTPSKVKQVAKEGKDPMQIGKTIPGKPKVGGAKDSYANDTVPATLEEGGIVIPRSVTQSKNPEKKAIEFVRAHYARGGQIPKKPKSK